MVSIIEFDAMSRKYKFALGIGSAIGLSTVMFGTIVPIVAAAVAFVVIARRVTTPTGICDVCGQLAEPESLLCRSCSSGDEL